ncbi:MAG: DinB family protein [Allomuricauda sp.]
MSKTLTEDQVQDFFVRIDNLQIDQKPLFGKMDAHQMICHCADFFRMAFGQKKATEYGQVDPKEITARAKQGETVPTPKGFGQVEKDGTQPIDFEEDKEILKKYILEFKQLGDNYVFAPHPYFGDLTREKWTGLAIYHLNHHLEQFNV